MVPILVPPDGAEAAATGDAAVAARPGPEETLFAQARVAFREMQAVPVVPAVDVQRVDPGLAVGRVY